MKNIATFNNNSDAIAVSQQLIEKHQVIDNTIVLNSTFDRAAFRLACDLTNVGYYFDVNYCNLNCKDDQQWQARETDSSNTMSIYVACLAAYNHGYLHGMWISCEQPEDGIRSDIEFMLSWSPVRHLEECFEWAIHDYDFGGRYLGEHENLEELSNMAMAIIEHGKAYEAYLTEFDMASVDDFQDRYCGEYESIEDYAYQYIEDTRMLNNIPDNIKMYFDYQAFSRDMNLSGDITFINGHIFYCH